MGLSKSTRIMILLAIDTAFFFLELIVGYAVHSLALVADSFHMLNDVISLLVGLWAVKVASQKTNSKTYTYGWQRAETLGALINGVFLVALCLSIFLEAIQRFVEPQEVSHPKLVLIVGSFGLASNIIGLFLFHDHGHGGHSHGHDEHSAAEEGHSHGIDAHDHAVADERGNVADVLPQNRIGFPSTVTQSPQKSNEGAFSPQVERVRRSSVSGKKGKRHNRSQSRNYSTLEDIYVHPSSFRNSIIESSRMHDNDEADDEEDDANVEDVEPTEQTSLLANPKSHGSHDHENNTPKKKDCHQDHKHSQPKDQKSGGGGGHGHSHGDLNMRGVFLHVLGDALGNIGVIGSALFIWLTNFSWRFYADPAVSLIITVIILLSAIPLCKAASRILLQAVPENLSIDDITEDITDLNGIVSCHHLHVWQLSDTKLIASLHVQVDFDFKGEGSARYMDLARQVRQCLHEYGIHSSTIQPEFCLDASHDHSAAGSDESSPEDGGSNSKNPSVKDGPDACLLECPDSCGNAKQCCEPGNKSCKRSNHGSSS
ncbi:zinc/cadmium resistance protein-like protein [Cucurbitaria berberidis CBS 394.84]|uniref:Zinc/cadmium resistance protein-like protein n=1 Tax=Cucurbitaria berberidis CBS 394.84 TaxID=1168544 RepID=A0A9P4L318_9PLEO|nr:zinc/cadmium resistance protein-like protein [Cucurbitaria berberidis CBS 394.84]KAF1840411.1 zinc/cadmium resistance protein-like protein [Cucurbitaria berberidis CBS 394.84]